MAVFPSSKASFSHVWTNDNQDIHLRDASFSSYLDMEDRDYVHNLAELIHSSSPSLTSAKSGSAPSSLGRNRSSNSELCVFGAERYFSDNLDGESTIARKKAAVRKQRCMKEVRDNHLIKNRSPAPSLKSEASWSSQTTFLPCFTRNPCQTKPKKFAGLRFFNGFWCKGSCDESVNAHQSIVSYQGNGIRKNGEVASKNPLAACARQHPQTRFQAHEEKRIIKPGREGYFGFPIIDTAPITVNKIGKDKVEELPKKSLEVFGYNKMEKDEVSLPVETGIPMITWDAIPKSQIISSETSGKKFEDAGSDSSSDLFEIEDLSGAGREILCCQTSDMASSCLTPRTQYEPSEVSIEWSVVSASAANSSAVSCPDEEIQMRKSAISAETSKQNRTKRGQQSGDLFGCKTQKAVNVAEFTTESAK
ncbi:hypothetical protein Ancab_035900 [Ancistrocladus abbreviatus]